MSYGHKVALVNLGCRVNRVELDLIARQLLDAGYQIVRQRDAEAIIVNTCAVTAEAEAKTRKAVRRAAGMHRHPIVIATGCVASLFADELLGLADGVRVEPIKSMVAQRLEDIFSASDYGGAACDSPRDETPAASSGDFGVTPTGRTRPGIKVQDGCDNRCSFCIVWKARGHSRSVDPDKVLSHVHSELASGAREIVLTGINLGNYDAIRADGNRIGLSGLIRMILDETDVGRIRLSSIEPPDVTSELIETMASAGERVAPFLHVCLQSGCDKTLHAMRRVYDSALYAERIELARSMLPDLALGCDLIVGFPGETDADFEESLSFCAEMRFSRMHIFRYSKRPGTPAAKRTDQVDPRVAAARAERMGELAHKMRLAEAARHLGHDELVLVQAPGHAVSGGLFDVDVDNDLPLGELVHVTPWDLLDDATLDARSSRRPS